ncbi:MAG: RHS repeat-associated core domain-containing protein [Verrucomicrobiota bacterium]
MKPKHLKPTLRVIRESAGPLVAGLFTAVAIVSSSLATNIDGVYYCPKKKQCCDPETGKAVDVEEDTSCSSLGYVECNSVEIEFNLGTAAFERPSGFSGMYVGSDLYGKDPGYPKDIREMKDFFYSTRQAGRWRATMDLDSPVIDADVFKISSLDYNHALRMEVIKVGGIIRQVKSFEYLVEFENLGPGSEGYTVKWWFEKNKGSKSGDLYQPVGDPFATITVSNPTPGTYSTMDVSLVRDTPSMSERKIHYRYVFSTNPSGNVENELQYWTDHPTTGTNPEQLGLVHLEFLTGGPTDRTPQNNQTRIRTVKRADLTAGGSIGNLTTIGRYREEYSDISGEKRLTKFVRLEDSTTITEGLESIYGYYDNPSNSFLHARQHWKKSYDGSWTIWDITANSSTQTIKTITPFKDGTYVLADDGANVGSVVESEARVETQIVTGNNMETTVNVLGQKVSRTIEDFLTSSGNHTIIRTKRFYASGPNDFLTSYEAFHPYGNGQADESGRIAWEVMEDGTGATYSYNELSSGDMELTKREGAANGSGADAAPSIAAGTETVTVYNEFWIPINQTRKDIASNLGLDLWLSTGEDMYGRPTRIEYNGLVDENDNAIDYETMTYDCCGLKTRRDRSGAVTTYYRDTLKRVYKVELERSSTSGTLTRTTAYSGLTTTTSVNGGTPATTFDTSKTVENLLGETIEWWAPDADGDTDMERTEIVIAYPPGGGRKVTVTDPLGGEVETIYWRDGDIASVKGSGTTNMEYDKAANSRTLTRLTAAGGTDESVELTSDYMGRPTEVIYPTTIANGADPDKQQISYYNSNGPIGSRGRRLEISDPDDVTVRYYYDSQGRHNKTIEDMPVAAGGGAQSRTIEIDYDTVNLSGHGTLSDGIYETVVTKINEVVTSESFRSPAGLESGIGSFGNMTRTIREVPVDGAWTVKTVSPNDQTSLQTFSEGFLKKTEYFDNGGTAISNLVSLTSYSRDVLGRIVASVDSRTGTTSYSGVADTGYTPSGNLKGMRDSGGRLTKYTYDALGRWITTTLPDTSVTHTTYTLRDEVEAVWGSQIYPTFRTYDEQGRIKTLRTSPDFDGGVPIDDGGSVTTWNYHTSRGWLDNKRDADGKGADYTYTAAGRLEVRKWARIGTGSSRVETEYGYEAGLLVAVTYSNDPASTPNLAYTYDAYGRPRTVTQGTGSTANTHTFVYKDDDNGSGGTFGAGLGLHQESVDYDNSTLDRTLTRHLDGLLRPTGYELKDGSTTDAAVSYGYDAAARLAEVDLSYPLPSSPAFTYGYVADSYGLIDSVTGPTNTAAVKNTWEGDRDVLLSKINHTGTLTSPVSKYDYAVSGASGDGANGIGQRKNLATTGSGFDNALSDTTATGPAYAWTYNPQGELVEADDTSSGNDDRAYQYDAIGNREKTVDGLLTGLPGTANYASNDLNEYTSVNLAGTAVTPGYDDDGNTTSYPLPADSDANAALVWDAENRLVEVTLPDNTKITYEYDYLGRRISRKVGTGTPDRYIYDGWNLIARYAGTTRDETYAWGLDLSGTMQGAGGVGGLLAVDDGSAIYYPTYDGNGNVSEYLDSSGTIQAHYEYDAFGNVMASRGSKKNDFEHRFSTKPLDNKTGLYYYGYRYYDPVTGRWPSRDPIGEQGGLNLFAFVANNGVTSWDNLGLEVGDDPFLPDPSQKPPGWNQEWPTGRDERGPYVENPCDGSRYYPHPEDDGHWPHYDKVPPDGKGKPERYPKKSKKPWPNQKKPPYGDQSGENPWPEKKVIPKKKPTRPVRPPSKGSAPGPRPGSGIPRPPGSGIPKGAGIPVIETLLYLSDQSLRMIHAHNCCKKFKGWAYFRCVSKRSLDPPPSAPPLVGIPIDVVADYLNCK